MNSRDEGVVHINLRNAEWRIGIKLIIKIWKIVSNG